MIAGYFRPFTVGGPDWVERSTEAAGAWPDRMSIGIPAAGQENTDPASYVSVARCTGGSWIMAYVPVRQLVEISTGTLAGDDLRVTVYDPESLATLHSFVTPRTASIRPVPECDLDTLFVIDAVF